MDASATIRSRHLRGVILRILVFASRAIEGLGYADTDILEGFRRSTQISASNAELREALADLVETGLAARRWDAELGTQYYTATARGRDFGRAGMPWDRIDEFTGGTS